MGNQFKAKGVKKIYVSLQIKKWEINMFLQYTLKRFISKGLPLSKNYKSGKVKLDRLAFDGQTCLHKSNILLQVFKY